MTSEVPRPDEGWQSAAACSGLDPSWFYPAEDGDYADLPGYQVCTTCPARLDCLAHALLEWENFGVWGGFSPDARMALRPLLASGAVTWDSLGAALRRLGDAA